MRTSPAVGSAGSGEQRAQRTSPVLYKEGGVHAFVRSTYDCAAMTIPKGLVPALVFLLVPLAIWYAYEPLSFSLLELGKVLGVIGLTMFTLSLLLSVRIPLQERIFGDIGASYTFHQNIGTLALMALALHPVFLAWSYFPISASFAASLLLPFGAWSITIGILGLYLLAACLICTYYVSLPYHIWKVVHKFLGLAFFFGALHSLFVAGTIQSILPLKIVVFLFLLLGVLAITYRALFAKLFVKRAPYVVTRVSVINDVFVDVTLAPKEQPITVKPGQFAYISYMSEHVKNEEHPFSIAGSRPDGTLRFITKNLGDFTNTLHNLHVGDDAMIEGPFGSFSIHQGGKEQCWIAGGIGITPFLAFAQALPNTHKATLVYSIKNEAECAVRADLDTITKEKPNISVVIWNSEKQGFLTANAALKGCNIATTDVFLCGPGGMVSALRSQLHALKVPNHHIHQESFSMLP